MKNNFSSSKKPKIGFVALLLFFCVLWGNGAMGQTTFTWTGATSSDWATPTNWTRSGGTNTTFPGAQPATDTVVINKNDAPNAPVIASGSYTVNRVTINNAFGTIAGATLTINSGATLIVTTTTSTAVILNGGNLINNGILTINNSAVGSSTFEAKGITCGTPTIAPTVANPTTYSYSGSGELNINITNATAFANSSAVAVVGLNLFATYNILFNGTTNLTLNSSNVTYAIRSFGGTLSSPLVIGGTGFTLNNNGGLIGVGQQGTVTVNAGTTLTLNSVASNNTSGIAVGNSSTNSLNFTNKGTINILGSSARSGIQFTTFTAGAAVPILFTNEGIINVNLNCGTVGGAPLSIGNGGSTGTTSLAVDLNNKGTLTLTNTSVAAGTGAAIFGIGLAQAPPVAITNNGTLNLLGSSYSYGLKFSIINNSILNTNSELRDFTAITNNVGGSINFVRTVATSTTRQVTFTVLTTALAGLGTNYTDINGNTYSVVTQKFASGTSLVTNVLSTVVNTPVSGNLTRVGDGTATVGNGTGDLTIAFTAFSASALNGALTSTTTNSGIINTDTASNLSVISGVTTTSTSVIVPGGSAGKGIATFSSATQTINGKLVVQVAGNTTAGIDYDQIINDFTDGGFNITGATLDITGISGTATPVDIVIANGTGTITGPFASVIGLTNGWSINYGVSGKVQLVYSATSPTANTWTGATDSSWINAGNWSAGVPDQNSDVTIVTTGNQPQIATNVNINSLTITSGSLTVNTGVNLTVTDAITNNGSLTIASNANLIQINNVSNGGAGTTTVNRNSNVLSRLDYTLWSSPVTNASQFLTAFSPATDLSRFYNYDEVTNLYSEIVSPAATPFAKATGYLIRMPNDAATAPATQTFAGIFTGVPNNGNISKAVTYSGAAFGYNMVGNPYPSTIDAQAFIAANTANIESSLYFWRKINAASGSAYAVYNPMGSTIATPSSALPNGTIQVGQGFFVKAKSASSVDFTNAMRVANNSNQFFKTKQVASKDRVWLNLTNTSGVFSQALIGYTADATIGVDIYDAKYINDSKSALTSNINDEEYTIQGRPAFDATDVVSLMFKTETAGDYTIALDHFDGVFATGQDVYLLDSKTATETNLKTGSYTFAATAGTDNARFSLKYQKTLKVDAQVFNENSVSVYKNNGTLYVNAGSVTINTIEVYDVQGRLLASQRNVKATTASINNLRASNQVLIVKIAGVDNSVVTKKVVN